MNMAVNGTPFPTASMQEVERNECSGITSGDKKPMDVTRAAVSAALQVVQELDDTPDEVLLSKAPEFLDRLAQCTVALVPSGLSETERIKLDHVVLSELDAWASKKHGEGWLQRFQQEVAKDESVDADSGSQAHGVYSLKHLQNTDSIGAEVMKAFVAGLVQFRETFVHARGASREAYKAASEQAVEAAYKHRDFTLTRDIAQSVAQLVAPLVSLGITFKGSFPKKKDPVVVELDGSAGTPRPAGPGTGGQRTGDAGRVAASPAMGNAADIRVTDHSITKLGSGEFQLEVEVVRNTKSGRGKDSKEPVAQERKDRARDLDRLENNKADDFANFQKQQFRSHVAREAGEIVRAIGSGIAAWANYEANTADAERHQAQSVAQIRQMQHGTNDENQRNALQQSVSSIQVIQDAQSAESQTRQRIAGG